MLTRLAKLRYFGFRKRSKKVKASEEEDEDVEENEESQEQLYFDILDPFDINFALNELENEANEKWPDLCLSTKLDEMVLKSRGFNMDPFGRGLADAFTYAFTRMWLGKSRKLIEAGMDADTVTDVTKSEAIKKDPTSHNGKGLKNDDDKKEVDRHATEHLERSNIYGSEKCASSDANISKNKIVPKYIDKSLIIDAIKDARRAVSKAVESIGNDDFTIDGYEDVRDFQDEYLSALPELTKIMQNASIGSRVKRCISGALSNLIDEETKQLLADNQCTFRNKPKTDFSEYYQIRCKPKTTSVLDLASKQGYNNTVSDIPDWFRALFKSGPRIIRLTRTFPAETADVQPCSEYQEIAKAKFAITISPHEEIEKISRLDECRIRVSENIIFSTVIPPAKMSASIKRAHWRKQFKCILTGSEPGMKRRVSFSGSHIEAPVSYVDGKNYNPRREKEFYLVFILNGNGKKSYVCGTYRRQMSSCDKFMTWRFKIDR